MGFSFSLFFVLSDCASSKQYMQFPPPPLALLSLNPMKSFLSKMIFGSVEIIFSKWWLYHLPLYHLCSSLKEAIIFRRRSYSIFSWKNLVIKMNGHVSSARLYTFKTIHAVSFAPRLFYSLWIRWKAIVVNQSFLFINFYKQIIINTYWIVMRKLP